MRLNTVAALASEARRKLHDVGSATPALDARLLLQAATGFTHADLVAEPEREVSGATLDQFNAFIIRRLAHEPVSRILGKREFFGREFRVTPEVLDPRADTECVVQLALRLAPHGRFIDLGTGSGAIAITLCAENENLSGLATDISLTALRVAEINAKALGVTSRLQFHQGAWLAGVNEKFDLIISNPPYIKTNAILSPDVQHYDPHIALFAGPDGLAAYREIVQQIRNHRTENALVIVEIGHDQAAAVTEIFASNGFRNIDKAIDIAGFIRGLAFRPVT